jgi:hypothetical protein
MTLSGRTRYLAAVGAAVALTVAAPAHAGDSKAAARGKPSVGQCRSLTLAQASASSNRTAPTGCSSPHNDRVIAVPTLPKGVSYAELDTARKLDRVAVKLCYRPFRKTLGQNDRVRNSSAYTYLYFQPTARQRSNGARWLRCDLTLRHGSRLANLPTDRKPALRHSRLPASVKRCLAGQSLVTTTCKASHRYRVAGAITVDTKRYPGRTAMIKLGRSRCPAITTTDADYRFTWSSKTEWNVVHDRTLVCYNRNS